ncbi:nucleotide-binding universal stress UspA family protein [Desulfosalsimonas propionicica]|uniref:Nucleotide-binding universal stress UspA family protein n=1 Tax=Desulfosalsimonas propionicica TaxID=332175 RepID=A0A7W0CCD2_9BACT|nr:universal stress protein [Desulfosalsimonas propionicica]MBA2883150.1 nucleotide-binding universal stress UspA family protein [Desulfosalsimonas propionicica]
MKIRNMDIKTILYTTDLSDTALHAFSYAASFADAYNSRLIILHVIEDYPAIEPSLKNLLHEEQWKAIKEKHIRDTRETLSGKSRDNRIVQEVLTRFSENAKAGRYGKTAASDEVMVLFGNPVEKIIETSKEKNCDLIVMGTHGHGLLQNLLGTTTHKVLSESKIPVVAVPIDQ